MATSMATEPESQRKTFSGAGDSSTRRRSRPTAGSCVRPPNMTCAIRSICALAARSMAGTP